MTQVSCKRGFNVALLQSTEKEIWAMNRSHAIEEHYFSNWKTRPTACTFQMGPVHDLPELKVLAFHPRPSRPLWTYGTCGMSLPGDPTPVELHLFSPIQADALVELLYAVTHFHRTAVRLDLGHTVNFGRPWLAGSRCSIGLVSLPYLDGPAVEECVLESEVIRCYWLIPITPEERELKRTKGMEVLESRLETSGFDYADPERASVA